jgi:hypothetical protein
MKVLGILLLAAALAAAPGARAAGYFPMYHTWPQPGGKGAPITLTYSFVNLLDGSLVDAVSGMPLPRELLRDAFEKSLWDYASILPIHFVEIRDSGPPPESGEYDPTGRADIRVGQVPHVDGANAYAYFPFDPASGLAGDIVFNAGRAGHGWTPALFYAVAQHELGHSLGMGHFVAGEPPQDPGLFQNAAYAGPRFPLDPGHVVALQGAYGAGEGSVSPIPLPASAWLLAGALAALLAGRRSAVPIRTPDEKEGVVT